MASIGTGLIILIVLWALALISILVLCSSQGSIKYVAVIPVLIASVVTIVLTLLPKESSLNQADLLPDYMYSYTPLLWILILSAMCLMLIVCLLIYFVTDIMEPRYAQVSKLFMKTKY